MSVTSFNLSDFLSQQGYNPEEIANITSQPELFGSAESDELATLLQSEGNTYNAQITQNAENAVQGQVEAIMAGGQLNSVGQGILQNFIQSGAGGTATPNNSMANLAGAIYAPASMPPAPSTGPAPVSGGTPIALPRASAPAPTNSPQLVNKLMTASDRTGLSSAGTSSPSQAASSSPVTYNGTTYGDYLSGYTPAQMAAAINANPNDQGAILPGAIPLAQLNADPYYNSNNAADYQGSVNASQIDYNGVPLSQIGLGQNGAVGQTLLGSGLANPGLTVNGQPISNAQQNAAYSNLADSQANGNGIGEALGAIALIAAAVYSGGAALGAEGAVGAGAADAGAAGAAGMDAGELGAWSTVGASGGATGTTAGLDAAATFGEGVGGADAASGLTTVGGATGSDGGLSVANGLSPVNVTPPASLGNIPPAYGSLPGGGTTLLPGATANGDTILPPNYTPYTTTTNTGTGNVPGTVSNSSLPPGVGNALSGLLGGTGSSNLSSLLGGLGSLASANYIQNLISQGTKASQQYTNMYNDEIMGMNTSLLNPFAPDRAQYATQLNALVSNPSSVTSTPGYQFGMDQGEQALQRASAAQGNLGSGQTGLAIAQYGQQYAAQQYQQQFNNLAGLSGATFSPQAINPSSAGNPGNSMLTAAGLSSSNINSALANLGYLSTTGGTPSMPGAGYSVPGSGTSSTTPGGVTYISQGQQSGGSSYMASPAINAGASGNIFSAGQ